MDRRELLRMIAIVTGGAVIGSEFFLTGCIAEGKMEAGFTERNIALLDEVGETILPATSSPGAKEAKVGEFMKIYVTDCYNKENQDTFIKGINELEDACKKMNGKDFMDCTPEQRRDFLISLEKEAKEHNKNRSEKGKPEFEFIPTPTHYYTMIKQLTLLGFFTSEIGATKALRHVAVPQKYDGALPYKKGDKAWAD